MEFNFGGVKENIITSDEFSLEKARQVLKKEVIAVLGYGIQGRAQALNMRDNGFNVIIGQRPGRSYDQAVEDGWVPGKTLFPLEEAAKKGTIIQYLLTDAGQKDNWPKVKAALEEGDLLEFAHGFSITFKEQTGVIPPAFVDVGLIAPKGSGASVRTNFLSGNGINSSFAVYQDHTGKAELRLTALGIAMGSGFLFPTTVEKEAVSDLVGERGVLMGALEGIIEAQYLTLRAHGHSPSEAFNETVEELTESLIRLVGAKGMDYMFANCSETARIGALRWAPRFRDTVRPLFESLYDAVKAGDETRIVLEESKTPSFKAKLEAQVSGMGSSELWKAGQVVRDLRPTERA